MQIDDPADWFEAQLLLDLYDRRRTRALKDGHTTPISPAERDLRAAFMAVFSPGQASGATVGHPLPVGGSR